MVSPSAPKDKPVKTVPFSNIKTAVIILLCPHLLSLHKVRKTTCFNSIIVVKNSMNSQIILGKKKPRINRGGS
jgi:hypothetical protein